MNTVCYAIFRLHVLNYISVRSILSFSLSFLFILCFGGFFITKLKQNQSNGQPISLYAPESHKHKNGTPTMGGLMMLLATISSSILFCDLGDAGLLLCLLIFICFGAIGFIDDYTKLKYNKNRGMTSKTKFILQILFSYIGVYVYRICYTSECDIVMPVVKHLSIILPPALYYAWCIFVTTGSSNAVNLTDGLDGLAAGSIISTSLCMAIISYLSGNAIYADYLHIQHIQCGGDICILLSAVVGATMGFMWFNAPPAKIFMGDTGSLSIGGLLGFISVILKHEIVFAIIAGVFVFETMSVVIQLACYKLTGKRPFLMAPIHHHFEKKGIPESTIVFRFWIISIILAILGLSIVKLK